MDAGDVALAQERSSLMEKVEFLAHQCPIFMNRWFTSLREDRMTRETFIRTQQQFFFAVRYFSRPMAALLARMPDSSSRQGLIHNLSEEHGFEDEDSPRFDAAVAHDLTFLAFMNSLGVSKVEMAAVREGPAVRAFNAGLMGACVMERTETAFACLGVIEYTFADICEMIGRKVVERGWIAKEDLVHYKLHAQIDKRHAADFFEVVEDAWNTGGTGRAAVEDGIGLGLYLFNRLYDDLDPGEAGEDELR
ncbi:MAG: iron-containing redox enzyme family protein [Verrucomicrobiaceae bacterium]|nr:MAG: iron-containing redox enzyme family protein [Verrucomicrobiaceae bacterium]